jgi:GxxExxY protein
MEECREPSPAYGAETYKHSELTQKIVGIFFDVYRTLGYGFLEKVYQNALAIRLRKAGFEVVQHRPIQVCFDGEIVGEYVADLVVDDTVILELKTVKELLDEHHAQLLNYLKATAHEVGLLLNFGPKPQVVRKAYDNARKGRKPF